MQSTQFTYKDNGLSNLLNGLISLILSAFFIYIFTVINPPFSFNLELFFSVGFLCISCLFIWIAFYYLNTFRKLFSSTRAIIINEKRIVLPEFSDSLNIIELSFDQIRKVYLRQDRYGPSSHLLIEYGLEKHACIDKNQLDSNDFDEICRLLEFHIELKSKV